MRSRPLPSLTLAPPAKVNLTLEILARRDDGFHGIRSVMVPIGLYDALEIAPAGAPSFTCEPAELGGDDNLVARALRAAGVAERPFAVRLRKRIPAGAGLGGGSSDGAMTLRAVAEGAFGPPPERDWLTVARELGSDVAFFLAGTAALVEGTGDRVVPAGAIPPWWIVLVLPPVHVATADAYRALAEHRAAVPPPTRPRATSATMRALEGLQRGDFADVAAAMTNDFEPLVAARYPPVAAALAALRDAGGEHVLLSGSGGACFALVPDEAAARALAASVDPAAGSVHAVPFAASEDWR